MAERRSTTSRGKRSRSARNINPLARRELAALDAGINLDELPLRSQVVAAESLAKKARARGQNLTLAQAMASIATAQVQRQNIRAGR